MTNYKLLIQKLDEFIRKYYINKVIRGSIYSIALLVGAYLFVSFVEYYLYLPQSGRKVLFFSYLLMALITLGYFVITPLLHYFRLGKIISHEMAAAIIGKHFQNVEDKLLNVLQLHRISTATADQSLIEASIDQKISDLKPLPFSAAINFNQNRKYVKYALAPVSFLVIILLAAPNILRESNTRLIFNNSEFVRQAPFDLLINGDLRAMQGEDYELKVKPEGDVVPNEVFVITADQRIKLEKQEDGIFKHTFRKVQKDIPFHLSSSGYDFEKHQLTILPKPVIVNFEVFLDYPDYIGKKDEILNNIGDITLPAGTGARWRFHSKNTDAIELKFQEALVLTQRTGENVFEYKKRLLQSQQYKVYTSNKSINHSDSIGYTINTVPDQFPQIQVDEIKDSTNRKFIYFLGEASDDYGIKNLAFRYKLEKAEGASSDGYKTKALSGSGSSTTKQFNYAWNVDELVVEPGDRIYYFFEVWDNDGVNGSKRSQTATMTFDMPTYEEYKQEAKSRNDNIKNDLEKALDEAQQLQKEAEQLRERLLQKKNLDWQDKKALEDLLEKQKQVQSQIDQAKENFNQNLQQQQEYENPEEQIRQKQEKLQELFDQIMDEETRKMFEEMEKLLEKMEQENALDDLEDMELSNEQLEKELDRMLELFKQLELEQKMEDIANNLEELANEQEELSEESKEEGNTSEELKQKQEELNKKFEELEEEMKEAGEMNQELENPMQLPDTDDLQEEIKDEMGQSQQKLDQNNKKGASENQKKASDKMQEMSQKMQQAMSGMEMEQMMEDMKALQQLLDNLIKLSFDQETLMDNFKEISLNSPQYVDMVQRQHKLKNDSKMVEDSLFALSKRVFQISSYVNKEISDINNNMDKAIEFLADRRKYEAGARQQYVMTGMNNLALMLDEIMQAMQQQMASQMQGSQMCQQPQSGQQMQKLGEMQQQLNEQMKQMKDGMKEGKGQGKMSKQLAEMAAKQAAIRKALQEMNKNSGGEKGNALKKQLEELAEQMEETEEDIVNKRLNEETLERQREILVRLLEAADAEKEREQSPERQSNSAEDITKRIPPSIEEYLKRRQAEVDLYKTVPPALKPFYRTVVEEYFKNINVTE